MIIFLFLVINLLFIWNLYLLDKKNRLEYEVHYLLKDNAQLRKEYK